MSKIRVEVGPPTSDVPGALHTMRLWLNDAPHVYTGARAKGTNKPAVLGHGITVTTRELPMKKILDEPAEEITITSPMLNATIWSSAANKFYAKEKQLKFAHLNVDLNWAKAGDRPMTRASRLLLKVPAGVAVLPSIGISGAEVKMASLNEAAVSEAAARFAASEA